MKKTKFSHRVIAVFFTLTFLQTLVPYNRLWANNNGPNAPEAAAFEPVDATDMVNLLTGDFSYVLPLLNVPSPEGGYPLALSYHAGIAMDQEASWVGLGWNLNPGAINRYVSGVPDDWKSTKKYSVFYDEGGVLKTYTGGVSVGWGYGVYSVGLHASYSEHQTSNGENSYNYNIGGNLGSLQASIGSNGFDLGVGVNDLLGIGGLNANISTSGLGLNYGDGSNNISVNQSFKNGNTTLGANGAGLGISLSSKNGLSANIGRTSLNFKGSESLSRQLSIVNRTLTAYVPIPIPGGSVNINGSYSKTKYWAYENDYSIFDGALYASNIDNSLNDGLFDYKIAFDSYESYYKTDRTEQSKQANYSGISYDSYSVSGQGVAGSIKPYIFQEAVLRNQERTIDTDGDGGSIAAAFYEYPLGSTGDKFTKGINDIHFYFENENSSFLKVNSGNWVAPNSSYGSVFSMNTTNRRTDSSVNINGESFNGYNSSTKRMRKGSYIETFTNQQILDVPSRIVQPYNFNRTRSRVPRAGIGAYRITTVDGKTYHYSIPVYQHEKFAKVTEVNKDIDKQFSEEGQLDPYATHWLLTAVTGPDYIDTNNNNIVDESDYGYWVGFDYGMWSEGFGWRTPTTGYETSDKTKTYEWGVKEIYYLDKIKTRTHTALFIKETRKDNLSSSNLLNIGTRSNPKVYNDIHIKSFVVGDDNKNYFNGIYDEINLRFGTFYVESQHKVFLNLQQQQSLRLKKIILLNNKNNYANIAKTNPSEPNEITGGAIKIDESFKQIDIQGRDLGTISKPITNRSWKANLYKNVLDVGDIKSLGVNIDSKAVKVIDFVTSYKLAGDTPNSSASNSRRLTLDQVRLRGKEGELLIPPYKFDYYHYNFGYDNSKKDNWGYRIDFPWNWSLKKITTPLGSSISVEFEEDDFRYEAAITSPSESNKKGGGIRVKNLTLEQDGEQYITSHKYNVPGTTLSSGVTSYAPSKNDKEVKFIGELPAPAVMYEYVTVEHKYATNQTKHKDEFRFKVLPKMVEKNGGFECGDVLSLRKVQNNNQNVNISGRSYPTNFSKFELVDHTVSLGRLISKKSYNEMGQLLSSVENNYYALNELQQGVHQETNKMYKQVREYSSYKYLLSASSKTKFPSVLKSTIDHSGHHMTSTYFNQYDFLSGQVAKTTTKLSDGTEIKTNSFPAYKYYNLMGSKADNVNNKNMLSQDAANVTQIKVGSAWKTIGADITTWNNNWTYRNHKGITNTPTNNQEKIWRKHKNYVWKGDIDADGAYVGYTGDFDGFVWGSSQTNPKWINTSTISKYDHFSMPLETSDINGNSVSTKRGDRESKVIAVANAKYTNMYYTGAEYFVKEGNTTYFDGEVSTSGNVISVQNAHTGKHIVKANSGSVFKVQLPADPGRIGSKSKFKASVWVRKGQESNLSLMVQNGSSVPFVTDFNSNETITAGDWVLLNGYIPILTSQAIVTLETSGAVDVDDFRLHPVSSAMTSYVYNDWDELTHILGANNLATQYEYDSTLR